MAWAYGMGFMCHDSPTQVQEGTGKWGMVRGTRASGGRQNLNTR